MAWVLLFLAGLFEVAWAIGLKYSDGFSRPLPSLVTLLSMATSLALLGLALRTLPLGTAYPVWTGIGTVGAVLLGIAIFREPATAARLVCIGLIIAGIGGLKFLSHG
jgi:quaternary ammonium compound-resistance protein SugE